MTLTMTTSTGSTSVGIPQHTQQPKKEKHLVHWFRKGWLKIILNNQIIQNIGEKKLGDVTNHIASSLNQTECG